MISSHMNSQQYQPHACHRLLCLSTHVKAAWAKLLFVACAYDYMISSHMICTYCSNQRNEMAAHTALPHPWMATHVCGADTSSAACTHHGVRHTPECRARLEARAKEELDPRLVRAVARREAYEHERKEQQRPTDETSVEQGEPRGT